MEKKKRRRWIAGFLAVIMTITGVGIPLPFPSEAYMAAEIDGTVLLPRWRKRMEKSRPV